jgi:hypothetical protein
MPSGEEALVVAAGDPSWPLHEAPGCQGQHCRLLHLKSHQASGVFKNIPACSCVHNMVLLDMFCG